MGERDGTLNYFENTGRATNPTYSEQTGTANPFNGVDVGDFSTPSFADIDGDDDLDLIVGEQPGTLNFYVNTGTATAPSYSSAGGGFDVGFFSTPSFADIDGDGDLDLMVAELRLSSLTSSSTSSASFPAPSSPHPPVNGRSNPFSAVI